MPTWVKRSRRRFRPNAAASKVSPDSAVLIVMKEMRKHVLGKLGDDVSGFATPVLEIQHDVIHTDGIMQLQQIHERVTAQAVRSEERRVGKECRCRRRRESRDKRRSA